MNTDSNTIVLLHLDCNLNDSTNHVNFVRDYGNATFSTESKFGNHALQLDGRTSIACPYGGTNGITLGNQFTIDFWAKTNRYIDQLCMFTIGTTHNDNAVCLYTGGLQNNKPIFHLGTYPSHLADFVALADNEWHHYAVVYNNGYYDAYFDGEKSHQ